LKKWKIAGINFDHMHMGDNLRMAFEHPRVDLVGICDEQPARMNSAIKTFKLPKERVFTDYRECLEKTKPDVVLLCPATAKHGEWTTKVAPYGVHIIMEKPFAASLREADGMIATMKKAKKLLAINWPLQWSPVHVTAKRLIDEGQIGDVIEVHHYGGNRGPLFHLADKIETTAEQMDREKPKSWFYKKADGGGSMLDYIGYGVTLGTWYHGGKKPIEVTTVVDQPKGLEVDEHSITVARYAHGLTKFETRWGTFTDPWTHQPQPKCGFVIVGTAGTIGAYDYEPSLRVQTSKRPAGFEVKTDTLKAPFQTPVQYLIHCIEKNKAIDNCLSPELSRTGQQIVETALLSIKKKKTVPLVK